MTNELVSQVKKMIASGKSHRLTAFELKISTGTIYTILTGKKYKYKKNRKYTKGVWLRGLSQEHRLNLRNIAKNKDISQSRLLLTYIRNAISQEPEKNKIYED